MKINAKTILGNAGRKLLNPFKYRRYMKTAKERQKVTTVADNAQLQLYSKMLPGDVLHYGYFDEPEVSPEEIPGSKY